MLNTPAILSQVPLFQIMPPGDLERLADKLRCWTIKRGEVLFRKESIGTTLFVVKQGRIKIVLPSSDGDEVLLAIFSQGDFFGEMALLDGMPRSADAVAMEDSEIMALERNDFIEFLEGHKLALQNVLASLSMRLRRTDDLLQDTCFLNISGRFAKRLVELAESHGQIDEGGIRINLDMTQRELASMVGATRESINKELRVLREKGLVSTPGGKLCITNLERLKRRVR